LHAAFPSGITNTTRAKRYAPAELTILKEGKHVQPR
jgi:hypothetical protein